MKLVLLTLLALPAFASEEIILKPCQSKTEIESAVSRRAHFYYATGVFCEASLETSRQRCQPQQYIQRDFGDQSPHFNHNYVHILKPGEVKYYDNKFYRCTN